jgi:hypothetical protein
MNRYKNYITAIAIATMVLGLTVLASAQRRNSNNNDYYGRADVNLSYAIKNLRNNSRRFQDSLDRELDRSRYDGTRREDNLNSLAKRFKNAAEDLDDEYEGRNSRSMNSSSDEARRVVSYGSQLDVALSRSRLTYNNFNLQQTWSAIETDLVTISRAYNIRYNGVYGRGRAGNAPWGYPDNRGPVNTNGRYNRNLRATIVNLKNNAKRFENRVDREWDNDRYGNRNYGRNLENLADRFANATDRLEDEYDNDRDYNRSQDEVRQVLSLGQQIDSEMSRARVSSSLRSDWNRIESDLRILANAYNMRYNGRSGIGIGDIIRNFPF